MSHSFGAALSLAALIVLLVLAHGRPRHVVAFAIYGASLILLYTASALYHSLHVSPRQADRLQRFDHIAIYLLIAGTYTPLCLVSLHGALGYTLLAVEYGIAFLGICSTLFWRRAPEWVRVALYLGMGWMIVFALEPLRTVWPPGAFAWMMAGGVVYTLGAVVFATDRPHLWPGKFSAHDLWHLFVLGGSACHFVLMVRYIAPAG